MKTRRFFHTAVGLALGLAAVVPAVRADVKMPNIFGSHMVLQRNQADKVWGWADKGEEVTVTIADQTKKAKADDKGAWSVMLDPMKGPGPFKMVVTGKNTITFEDVLVGEVWICSGQSNMQWAVQQSNDGDLEAMTAKFGRIRFISVPQVGTQTPQNDFNGKWEACNPNTVKQFSGVGYFFGRQLYQTLNVPIGLIDDAWGGSSCEAWVRRDILEKDPQYKPLIDRWVGMEKAYEAEKAGDAPKTAAKKKDGGGLAGQMSGNARPGNIYNGVLKPTIGYGIKGAIWYQGESNASRAYQYRELFPLMIKSWREEWGIGDFSFYWVQLADYLAEKPEPGDSSWAELREAQSLTQKLPNSGQAVIIDLGEARDIHPRNKQDVAMRLARLALAKDYGVKVPYMSPTFKSMEKKDGKIILTFDHVGDGGLYALRLREISRDPMKFRMRGSGGICGSVESDHPPALSQKMCCYG